MKNKNEQSPKAEKPTLNELSEESKKLLERSDELARKYHHGIVSTVHLAGVVADSLDPAAEIYSTFGVTRDAVEKHIESLRIPYDSEPKGITDGCREAISRAAIRRHRLGSPAVTPLHLAYGLVEVPDTHLQAMFGYLKTDIVGLKGAIALALTGSALLEKALARKPRK